MDFWVIQSKPRFGFDDYNPKFSLKQETLIE